MVRHLREPGHITSGVLSLFPERTGRVFPERVCLCMALGLRELLACHFFAFLTAVVPGSVSPSRRRPPSPHDHHKGSRALWECVSRNAYGSDCLNTGPNTKSPATSLKQTQNSSGTGSPADVGSDLPVRTLQPSLIAFSEEEELRQSLADLSRRLAEIEAARRSAEAASSDTACGGDKNADADAGGVEGGGAKERERLHCK